MNLRTIGWQQSHANLPAHPPITLITSSSHPCYLVYSPQAANCKNTAFANIRDSAAAEVAHATGAGGWIERLSLGGGIDPMFGGPPLVCSNVEVRKVTSGEYTYTGPMYTGMTSSIGKSALVSVRPQPYAQTKSDAGGWVDVLIASENCQVLDKGICTDNGA